MSTCKNWLGNITFFCSQIYLSSHNLKFTENFTILLLDYLLKFTKSHFFFSTEKLIFFYNCKNSQIQKILQFFYQKVFIKNNKIAKLFLRCVKNLNWFILNKFIKNFAIFFVNFLLMKLDVLLFNSLGVYLKYESNMRKKLGDQFILEEKIGNKGFRMRSGFF